MTEVQEKDLTKTEKRVYDLLFNKSVSISDIATELHCKTSSIKTYISRIKKKLDLALKSVVKSEPSKQEETTEEKPALYRCKSFTEFCEMMNKIEVNPSTDLLERVNMFKEAYCKVCIFPTKCDQCPTKVLIKKYLFNVE